MKAKERKVARNLRFKGKSVREIVKAIKCSKSTISRWVQDISLTEKQIKRLRTNQDKARAKAAKHPNSPKQKWGRIRKAIFENAKQEISQNPDKTTLKLIGAALYWAEGYTAGRNKVFFSNSDPAMLRLMMRFFREICRVPEGKFRGGINIHSHSGVAKAKRFWSNVSKIPMHNFHKVQVVKSRASRNKRHTLPYGTFGITISDTRLLTRIKGWINGFNHWIEKGK